MAESEVLSAQAFAAKVKEKYPEYKDVDNLTLAKKMVEKYPEYSTKVSFEHGDLPLTKDVGNTFGVPDFQESATIMADGSQTKPISALKSKIGTQKNLFLAHPVDGMKADMRSLPTGEDKLPEIKNALQNEVLNQNSKSLEDIGVKIPILANKEINPPGVETDYSNELINKFTHNKKDMMLDNPNYRGQIAEQLSKKYNVPQPQIEDYLTKLNDNKKEIRENLAEISLNPKNDKAYSSLGNNYFGIGEYDQAEKVYMAALSTNPNSEGAKNGLGSVALAKKDYPTAVQIFTELAQTNPNTDNIAKLATATYGTGNFEAAKQLADQAVTAGGDFPDSYALKIRATANAALGDNAASVADLKASKVAEDLATDQTVEYTNEKGQTQRITKRQQELDNEAQSLNAFVDVAHEVIQKGIDIVPEKIVADAIMQICTEMTHWDEVEKGYDESGENGAIAATLAKAARVGFSALAVYSPEVQKFMQQMQVGETILPSQAIGMVMQPISMMFTNEGASLENKNWAQLADIPVSLLIFHGLNVGGKKGYERAVELGDKIKQNLPLTKNEFAEIADGFNGITPKEVLAMDNNIAKNGTINTELSAVADSWKSLGEGGLEDTAPTGFEKPSLVKPKVGTPEIKVEEEHIRQQTVTNEIANEPTNPTVEGATPSGDNAVLETPKVEQVQAGGEEVKVDSKKQVEVTPTQESSTKVEGFKQAGEKARDTKDATHIGRWMLDNSKKGDVVRFEDGGYEVTEVTTKKDGTKELVLTPFEFNEDGSKDYNNTGIKIISEQSIKNGSNLFENAYTNSKGERVLEQSTYEPVEQSLKEQPKVEKPKVEEQVNNVNVPENEVVGKLKSNEIISNDGLDVSHDNGIVTTKLTSPSQGLPDLQSETRSLMRLMAHDYANESGNTNFVLSTQKLINDIQERISGLNKERKTALPEDAASISKEVRGLTKDQGWLKQHQVSVEISKSGTSAIESKKTSNKVLEKTIEEENANNKGISDNEALKGNEGEVIADKESKNDKAGEGDGGDKKSDLDVPENQNTTQKELKQNKNGKEQIKNTGTAGVIETTKTRIEYIGDKKDYGSSVYNSDAAPEDIDNVLENIKNGNITEKQVEDYTEQDESVIADIERKAESDNETELNEAVKQADELISETSKSGTPPPPEKPVSLEGETKEKTKLTTKEKIALKEKELSAKLKEGRNKAGMNNLKGIFAGSKEVVELAMLHIQDMAETGVATFKEFKERMKDFLNEHFPEHTEEDIKNLWNDAVNEKPLDEVSDLHAAQNATIEAKRKELGLDPMLSKLKTTAPKMLEEAINIIADGKVPDMVKKALQENRFTFTAPEQIAIDHIRDQLHEEHLQLDKDLIAARGTNDINKVGELESQRALKRLQIDEYDTVLRNTGTTSAQVLAMRRAYVNKQLTAATILSTMRADSKTGEVSKEYVKAVEDIAKERDELVAKSKILEDNLTEQKRLNEQAQKDFEKELQKARTEQAQKSNKKEARKRPVDLAREAEKERLRKILGIKSRSNTNALFDPSTIINKDFIKYHKMVFEDAVGDFRHFTKEMIKDFGNGIKEHLPKLFKDSGGTDEQINAAKKTDIELNGEFDILTKKAILDADGEFHEGLKGVLDKMFNNRVEAGETDYKKNVQSIYDALEQHIKDLDKNDLGDLIGGYGKFKELTKDPAKLLAAEGRRNLVLDAKLREVNKGVLPKRNGQQRALKTKAERDKETAIAKGIREQNLTPEPNEQEQAATYASELESYHRSLERQIEDYDAEGKSGVKKERTVGIKRSEKFTDTKSKELEAERDRVKAIRDAVLKERAATELEKTVKRAKQLTDDINKAKKEGRTKDAEALQKEKDLTDGEIGNLVNAVLKERTEGEKKIDSLRKQIDDVLNGNTKEKTTKPELTDAEKQQVKVLQAELQKAKIDAGLIEKPLTAEEKQLESLQNQLDDLYAGKVKETADKKVDSAAVKELKDKIAAQRELMGLKAAKAEAGSGTINAIQKGIDDINAEIESLNSGTFDKEQTPNTRGGVTNFKTVKEKNTPQLTEEAKQKIKTLQGERDALQEQKNNLLPQHIKDLALINKTLKNRNRRLQFLRETIKGAKDGTISLDTKAQKKLEILSNDPNVKKAQKELDDTNIEIKKHENELYAIKEEHRLLNRSGFEMFVDKINDFTRNGAISRLTAIPKILGSGFMSQMFRPIENLVGVPSKYMMPKSVRSTATMEGQPYSLNAEAAVGKLLSPNSWKEGARKFATGGHRQDFLYGDKIVREGKSAVKFMGKTYHFYDPMSVFGRSHALAKTPGYMAGYERNLRYARENAMAFHPEYFDSNNHLTPEAAKILEKAAHEFALPDAMLQPNGLAKSIRGGIHRMENSKKFGSRAVAKVGTNIFKVLNVSANYFATQLEYLPLAGTLKAYTKLLDTGEMTPERANDILRSNKRGMVGLGLFMTGMAFPQVFSGFDDKNKSGNIKIGDYEIPHWASHLPFFMAMQLGATVRHYMDSDPKDKHAFETFKNTADGIINQNPFAYTAHSFIHAMDSKTKASEFLYNEMFGQLIPQAAKEIGEWRDKDLSGETIKRQAHKVNDWSDVPKFASDMTRLASGINRDKVGKSKYQFYESSNSGTQKFLEDKGIEITRFSAEPDHESGKEGTKVNGVFIPLTTEQEKKVDAEMEKIVMEEIESRIKSKSNVKFVGFENGELKQQTSIGLEGWKLQGLGKENLQTQIKELKERAKYLALVNLGYIKIKDIEDSEKAKALKEEAKNQELINNK